MAGKSCNRKQIIKNIISWISWRLELRVVISQWTDVVSGKGPLFILKPTAAQLGQPQSFLKPATQPMNWRKLNATIHNNTSSRTRVQPAAAKNKRLSYLELHRCSPLLVVKPLARCLCWTTNHSTSSRSRNVKLAWSPQHQVSQSVHIFHQHHSGHLCPVFGLSGLVFWTSMLNSQHFSVLNSTLDAEKLELNGNGSIFIWRLLW